MPKKRAFRPLAAGAATAILCLWAGAAGGAAGEVGATPSQPSFRSPTFPWDLRGAAQVHFAPIDAPRGALERLAQSYRDLDLETYAALLTADYRFITADPRFDASYPDGFDRTFDIASSAGLFNATPIPGKPAVTSIDVELGTLSEGADPEHADSLGRYRLIIAPHMKMTVHAGEAELHMERSLLAFYVVRGDAAVLFPGAPADASHWYLRRWVETPDEMAANAPRPAAEPSLRMARNPASGPFELDLTLPEAGLYDVELFDVAGRRIGRRPPVRFPAGASHYRLGDTARLPAGIYWIRLARDGRTLVTRVATRL